MSAEVITNLLELLLSWKLSLWSSDVVIIVLSLVVAMVTEADVVPHTKGVEEDASEKLQTSSFPYKAVETGRGREEGYDGGGWEEGV